MSAGATRGHRAHLPEGRRTPAQVWLSTDERAVVEVAAGAMGLKRGAFVAAAAVRAARAIVAGRESGQASDSAAARSASGSSPVPLNVAEARELLDEVRQLRRLMGNVAGNLNDVARHANSTGELAPESAAVLDFVRRTNTRVDDELMRLLRRLR
ncbi:hypothetical protein LH935_28240 (plasmid) [Gordonia polyisoprenivorans]|uniref:hypothetical protein n=1 Tax=Gordonia polyisoprenivorans TaxID=84595 RepID=UPI002234B6F7|nr:hypothetical protein LH935_28240 [Gordonia polyisoprenivorans]